VTGEAITLESLRRRKKPNSVEDWIAGDAVAAEALEEARKRQQRTQTLMDAAERNVNMDAAGLERVYERAHKADQNYQQVLESVKDHVIKVRFEAIGSRRYDDLVELHEMDSVRRKQYLADNPTVKDEQVPTWDPETFHFALIAHSAVEPQLTIEEWEEWLHDDSWNGAELVHLFTLAYSVNNSRRIVNLGKDLSEMQNSTNG
jgi:hypothetical protein